MRRLTPHATLTAVVLNIAIAVTCAHAQTSVRMLVGSPAGGADLTHVPYRGSGPQSSDLLAGHALFGFTQIPNVTPHVPDKHLKAIAVTGERRSRLLPQTPTMAELAMVNSRAPSGSGCSSRPVRRRQRRRACCGPPRPRMRIRRSAPSSKRRVLTCPD